MTDTQSSYGKQGQNEADEPRSVGDILAALGELGEQQDRVHIGDIAHRFGRRSYGPFLIIPALIEISPIGGIPAVPTFIAIIVALVAVQLLLRRKHIYLPPLLRNRSISGAKVKEASEKLKKLGEFMDRWFHGRLRALVHPPVPRIAGGIVLLLCASVPPLELIPFASTLPMLAIMAFGLALLVRDGLLMIAAMTLSGGAVIGGIALASPYLAG